MPDAEKDAPSYSSASVYEAWRDEEKRLGRPLTDAEERAIDDRVYEAAAPEEHAPKRVRPCMCKPGAPLSDCAGGDRRTWLCHRPLSPAERRA